MKEKYYVLGFLTAGCLSTGITGLESIDRLVFVVPTVIGIILFLVTLILWYCED